MLPEECPVSRQLLDSAVKVDLPIRHFTPTFGGKDKHRADTAVDVDQMVFLCCTGRKRKLVERVFVFSEFQRQSFEQTCAVMECHCT